VADRAPESGFVDPFDDDHGKQESWDLNAADQTVCRDSWRTLRGSWGLRLRHAFARRALVTQQAVEIPALTPLENPGIHQCESAITQEQDGAGKERALGPLQNPPE
jgi:hypothetical protein